MKNFSQKFSLFTYDGINKQKYGQLLMCLHVLSVGLSNIPKFSNTILGYHHEFINIVILHTKFLCIWYSYAVSALCHKLFPGIMLDAFSTHVMLKIMLA